MPNKYLRYTIAILLIFGLILVRKYEDILFYDPFLIYFQKEDYSKFPSINFSQLNISIVCRYFINSVLTLLIIGILFWKKMYLKFSVIILLITLVILLPIYNYQITTKLSSGQLVFFYIRRFLIQPMFFLILIPCFYYQELQNKKAIEN